MTDKIRCGNPSAFRYTWPGNDETFICSHCTPTLTGVAQAIGLHLQLIPVAPGDGECSQIVGGK